MERFLEFFLLNGNVIDQAFVEHQCKAKGKYDQQYFIGQYHKCFKSSGIKIIDSQMRMHKIIENTSDINGTETDKNQSYENGHP